MLCVCVFFFNLFKYLDTFFPQHIWSTSVDGKIKEWTYDKDHSIAEYDAPGCCCTTMSFGADGERLVYWNYYLLGFRPSQLDMHYCLII